MMLSCNCEQCAGRGRENLLHLACEYNSPEYIIKKLMTMFPKYVFEFDNKHRLPLHVAIENDGKYRIVKSLLRKNEEAASVLDENGRSPLLIYFYSRSLRDVKLINEEESIQVFILQKMCQDIKIINLICSISFFSILNTDNDGKGVLEYAIYGGTPQRVVSILKKMEIFC